MEENNFENSLSKIKTFFDTYGSDWCTGYECMTPLSNHNLVDIRISGQFNKELYDKLNVDEFKHVNYDRFDYFTKDNIHIYINFDLSEMSSKQ